MFNFLLSASYESYFNFQSDRGYITVISACLLAVALIACIVVYFVKKELLSKAIKVSFLTFLLYIVGIIVYSLVKSIIDGDFKTIDATGEITQIPFLTLTIILTIALMISLIVIPLIVDKSKYKSTSKSIAYASICLALAFGLSYIRLYRGPYGGSITLASLLPIALYSYMFGAKKGLVVGFIYSILQFIQAPYFYHILQFLLDYVIAFSFIGIIPCVFKKVIKNQTLAFTLGFALAIIARFISHFISGAVFFGIWAPETFTSIWAYSFVYNFSIIIPDGLIAIVASVPLFASKAFQHQINQSLASENK